MMLDTDERIVVDPKQNVLRDFLQGSEAGMVNMWHDSLTYHKVQCQLLQLPQQQQAQQEQQHIGSCTGVVNRCSNSFILSKMQQLGCKNAHKPNCLVYIVSLIWQRSDCTRH